MKTTHVRIWSAALVLLMLACCLAFASAEPVLEETTKGGKVARRTWMDGGVQVNGPEGYSYITFSYSDTTVTEKYYTADDEPFTTAGGYHARALTYGNKHRLTEITYYNEEEERTECLAGYSRVRIAYTAKGQETGVNYYDADNQLTMVPSLGYAAILNEYRGTTLTKRTYFDDVREPVDIPAGYAVMIQTVNKSNKVTGIRYEHANGTPATCPEGWSSCEREVDKRGRVLSLSYRDTAGMSVNIKGGYALETRKWEGENVCVISRFDAAGSPVPFEEGVYALRQEMNGEGRVIRETYLDLSGSPTRNPQGYSGMVYAYDGAGAMISATPAD